MSRFHPLRVVALTPETRDAVVVTFAVPEELRESFRFTPGQHLTLRADFDGAEIRRSYSICSAPFEPGLRIAIKRVQDGLFSTWAHRELRPGHAIDCMEPAGHFAAPLEPQSARHHVAFAAGSGITPILSILKATLAGEPKSRFTLVYGNRSSSSVLFKEELEDLKDEYLDRLSLVFILSREQQDVELFNGRLGRETCNGLLRHWIDPRNIDVAYLCGPGTMIEEVAASLEANGVPRDHIRTERFGTAAGLPRRQDSLTGGNAGQCRVAVIQDGRQREFSARLGGGTLLEAALTQGIDLPYSCKSGVCSTCRCKMTSGEVDMDVNFALEDYEVARGFILPCQSYPLTTEIVLDFDQES